MQTYARPLIAALAALVLAASTYALYVHYQLLRDPTYVSACEVSATVSCQQVFTSPYGSAFGIPVAAGGAIWASLVLLFAIGAMRAKPRELATRLVGYIFVLATIGLGAVFYFGYASFVVLGVKCPICITMYVGIVGIFLLSAALSGPLADIPAKIGQDFALLRRSNLTQVLAAAWVVGAIALVVLFPRDEESAAAVAAGTATPPPLAEITPELRAEVERWLDSAPRLPEAQPTGDVKVLVMKFNDYQCPSCRQAWRFYQHIFDRYEALYPGVFVFDKRDYPLETECGMGDAGHPAACEAAVAVRLAREKGLDREMGAWLYEHQAGMSRDIVKEGLEEVAGITNFDDRYDEVLPAVRADAELGNKLGVMSTPTLFLNGILMESIRPEVWDAAIAYELRKAGVPPAD